MRAIRWTGEADRYLGPFTYARERSTSCAFALVLGSGDGDDYPGCRLRLTALGRTLIVALPPLIKPWRRWVATSHYAWSENPRGGYWDTGEREFGFTVYDGHLSVAYGRVTHDSSTEQRWGYSLPWRGWRHVRFSIYGLDGEHLWSQFDRDRPRGRTPGKDGYAVAMLPGGWHDARRVAKEAAPKVRFDFTDFDGQPLIATTQIHEREWRRGEGWWKWLSLVWPKKVSRSLDITFSGETGRRKGSWKGGTIGHGIEMQPGELHEHAFRRYCAEHGMTFVGVAAA